MSKVIYSMLVSLDGYISGRTREIDWTTIDEEFHRFANAREREVDVHLYGRRMHELMADFWWTADRDPTYPDYIAEYARLWQRVPKVVFSSTLTDAGPNARLASGDIVEEVARLKAEPGGTLTVGGATLAASFLRQGLIDEVELYLQPVVLGGGTPMFPELSDLRRLRLLETHTFTSGVVMLRYALVRDQPLAEDVGDLPAGIGNPARRALATIGVVRLEQLTAIRDRDLLALHGVGPKAIRVLRDALAERGLAFAEGA